jgi:chromosome segregation protein
LREVHLRIKSLQISGFKSFVDKTVFSFQPGITGVVGPNGCGKSNVVDAMRWAMGEQSPRRLRGKGMDDVIFAGSEVRAPVSMAEVVLTFDNSVGTAPPAYAAYSEIQIARRLYRSGESEYLLNKTPVRLRDVVDFFRDTGIGTKGYTIVEQGQIASIVSAKPDDRRILIEEAAGISKYKARRREAERKLQATEQNLVRVTDVLGEIRRQINSIERQARKAARYKRLRETQRVLELTLAADERRELVEGMDAVRQTVASRRDEVAALGANLAERELTLEKHRLALTERERILHQGDEVLFELRSQIKDLEARISYETREREALALSVEQKGEERERLAERLRYEQGELETAESELQSLDGVLTQETEGISAAEAEVRGATEALRRLEAERDTANAALVDLLTRIARDEDRVASVDDRRAEMDQRLRAADDVLEVQQSEASQTESEQSVLEEGLRNLLAERDRLMGSLRDGLEAQRAAQEEQREAGERLNAARERRETRRARHASLRELLDARQDLSAASRHLLEAGDAGLGIRAVVRDAMDVPRELELAVGAVLAERADALVLERPEGVIAALEALRHSEAGRGVFLVELPADPASAGIVPLGESLLTQVRPKPGFEGVAHALLSSVNLVDDLAEVLRVYGGGRIPATFVTPAGDVLSPDGVVRGGGDAAGATAFSLVREVRELESEVDALDREVVAADAAARGAEQRALSGLDEVENLRNRHHTAALAVANHEKDLERTLERVKALGQAREDRVAERAALLTDVDDFGLARERLVSGLEDARRRRGECQHALDGLGLRIGSAGREAQRLDAELTQRRVEHAGRVAKRDRVRDLAERARVGVAETREWMERREREIAEAHARRAQLATSLEEAEQTLNVRLGDEEQARASTSEKRAAFEREAEAVRTAEDEARALRGREGSSREALQQSELVLRERELGLQHLEDQIRDKWGVDIATWTPPDPEAVVIADGAASEEEDEEAALAQLAARDVMQLSREERRERVDEVRRKLEALGEVNLGAIEEHEELAERFRFLSEQKTDLETTVASLRDAITRINRTSRKRFRETFDAVNERFQKNYPRLFRGGKASLFMAEDEDVLEAGVDIQAQPPGKRLQNVNLLSGGEKTLTAIALLISLFQVRPSPFFLLDEVDAALDDANVGRFNDIVREMAEESQFLVITHNKRTIEIADVLYGVTMEEKGVSKLVAVDLH